MARTFLDENLTDLLAGKGAPLSVVWLDSAALHAQTFCSAKAALDWWSQLRIAWVYSGVRCDPREQACEQIVAEIASRLDTDVDALAAVLVDRLAGQLLETSRVLGWDRPVQ